MKKTNWQEEIRNFDYKKYQSKKKNKEKKHIKINGRKFRYQKI